jgi:hypothetical protein
MSEEIKQEVPAAEAAPAPVEAPKPKQFLIMADELHMAMLGKLLPGLLFVQVEGMAMQNNDTHMLLVNPLPKVAPATAPVEGIKADEPKVD